MVSTTMKQLGLMLVLFSCHMCFAQNVCDSFPCLNGATCDTHANGTVNCTCRGHHHGTYCERHPCVTNPCLNGGTCTVDSLGFRECICSPAFSGVHCAFHVCDSFPCLNGATCDTHANGTVKCTCTGHHHGATCGRHPCSTNPCLNGGTCTVDALSFRKCVCAPGYSGVHCASHVCDSFPCLNRATCDTHANGTVNCTCRGHHHGIHCERHRCFEKPCKNGGICTSDALGFVKCMCASGWSGDTCEEKIKPKCPRPFERSTLDGTCYFFAAPDKRKFRRSWMDAHLACKGFGQKSGLVSIMNREQFDYIVSRLKVLFKPRGTAMWWTGGKFASFGGRYGHFWMKTREMIRLPRGLARWRLSWFRACGAITYRRCRRSFLLRSYTCGRNSRQKFGFICQLYP